MQPYAAKKDTSGLFHGLGLEQGMDFWQEFNEQCLQSPWIISPDGTGVEIMDFIPSGRAFIFGKNQPDEAFTMMSKMVAALKLDQGQVNLLEADESLMTSLENHNAKKIVFFGKHFPGAFGEAFHWSGHKVVKTHGLGDLLSQPTLKKETWEHLKLFAGLS